MHYVQHIYREIIIKKCEIFCVKRILHCKTPPTELGRYSILWWCKLTRECEGWPREGVRGGECEE